MKIPEAEMKAIVQSELPQGVFLDSVDLGYGCIYEGGPDSFVLRIQLKEDESAQQHGCPGLTYNIAERMRALLNCTPEQLFISVRAVPLDMPL